MEKTQHPVDGFRFLPPKLAAWIRSFIPAEPYSEKIPFQPLARPLNKATVALVTSAGISMQSDPPFDMQREKSEPTWGDPTYREIRSDATAAEIDVNHLHINTGYIKSDINVILPLQRLEDASREGLIGRPAPTAYSFYGFQWEREDFLDTGIRPMIDRMKSEAVDAVLLTPA